MRVCVVGLEEIGGPTFDYIRYMKNEVWGYDLNPKKFGPGWDVWVMEDEDGEYILADNFAAPQRTRVNL